MANQIHAPGALDISLERDAVNQGDTLEFVRKFNLFQSELLRFSEESNAMATGLNELLAEFQAAFEAHSSALQDAKNAAVARVSSVADDRTHELSEQHVAAIQHLKQEYEALSLAMSEAATAALNDMQAQAERAQQLTSQVMSYRDETGRILAVAQQEFVKLDLLRAEVIEAQKAALIVATEQLPDGVLGQLEAELRRSRMSRLFGIDI